MWLLGCGDLSVNIFDDSGQLWDLQSDGFSITGLGA